VSRPGHLERTLADEHGAGLGGGFYIAVGSLNPATATGALNIPFEIVFAPPVIGSVAEKVTITSKRSGSTMRRAMDLLPLSAEIAADDGLDAEVGGFWLVLASGLVDQFRCEDRSRAHEEVVGWVPEQRSKDVQGNRVSRVD
jgi:hypothetical protein